VVVVPGDSVQDSWTVAVAVVEYVVAAAAAVVVAVY
jgi:hypothetical protein